jgi:hypothetical protein
MKYKNPLIIFCIIFVLAKTLENPNYINMAGFVFFKGPFSFLSFWRLKNLQKFTSCSNFQFSISLVFGEISPVQKLNKN